MALLQRALMHLSSKIFVLIFDYDVNISMIIICINWCKQLNISVSVRTILNLVSFLFCHCYCFDKYWPFNILAGDVQSKGLHLWGRDEQIHRIRENKCFSLHISIPILLPKSDPLSLSRFFLVTYQIYCHPLSRWTQTLHFHLHGVRVWWIWSPSHSQSYQWWSQVNNSPFSWLAMVFLWVFQHIILPASLVDLGMAWWQGIATYSCCCQCYPVRPINPNV